MQYRNNLSDVRENSYFKVIVPFEVYVRVGYFPSNTYVGSSRVFASVYEKMQLKAGTVIYDLAGGVFVSLPGRVKNRTKRSFEVKTQISEKHLFEKVYLPPIEQWPVECLERLPKDEILPPSAEVPTLPAEWVYKNAKAVGRSDSFVLVGKLPSKLPKPPKAS